MLIDALCKRCGGNERRKDGRCAACERERDRLRRRSGNNTGRSKKWREDHPNYMKEYAKRWRATDSGRRAAAGRSADPEQRAAMAFYMRDWAAKNPEKIKAKRAAADLKRPGRNVGYKAARQIRRNLDELSFIFFKLSERAKQ